MSVVHVRKGTIRSPILDRRQVRRISAYLVEGDLDCAPARLVANARKSFIGSYVLGMGFTFDDIAAAKGEAESLDTMRALIAKDPRNAERIFPYIGGDEVNTSPTHAHHRYVIDFADYPLKRDVSLSLWENSSSTTRQKWINDGVVPQDYPGSVAADWSDLLSIVENRVKPERVHLPPTNAWNRAVAKRWWQWGAYRRELNATISSMTSYFFIPNLSPNMTVARLPAQLVAAAPHNVIAFSALSGFAALQSRPHEVWARFFSSSMKDDLRYTPSDGFETFPFPEGFETSPELEAAGQAYHDHRAALMVARYEGMTKTYNRFHDVDERSEDIVRLRALHADMDRAVLGAYGWDDLSERAEPVFLDETNEDDHTYQGRLFWPSEFRDEVLARLLALNAERHAEEVRRGIAPGWKGNAGDGSDDDVDAE